MKAVLALALSLPLIAFANTENLPAPASSAAPPPATTERVNVTTPPRATQTEVPAAREVPASAPRSRAAANADFKADLAYCRQLPMEDRRGCERETHAARAEGLYR